VGTVVFVDYARSPEVHYSVAIEQAYAAAKWIAENGALLFRVNPWRLAWFPPKQERLMLERYRVRM